MKYILSCSSLLYESVTHDPMAIKQTKKKPPFKMIFLYRECSEYLENHPFFKTVRKHARAEKTMKLRVQCKARLLLEPTHYTFQNEDEKCLTNVSGTTF